MTDADIAKLNAALADAASADDPRAAALSILAESYAKGREGAVSMLGAGERQGREVADEFSRVMDITLRAILDFVTKTLHPARGRKDKLSVIALGGYGRAEMAPFSDVDLLFLTSGRKSARVDRIIETVLYLLWDLKLKVGQAVRSVDECIDLAKADITIRTSLLEKRLIWGDREAFSELRRRMWDELFGSTGREFTEAKLAERDARHSRHGGSRYLVEPNVKEAKGGLRDLQTLFWIAKYIYQAETVSDLIAKGVFEAEEAEVFLTAERFLWTVRCHLHVVAGRAQEQLTFDHQVEIAERMGFEDQDGKRAVEVFMQRYFRRAKDVGELTRFFCAALEADQKKQRPGFSAVIRALTSSVRGDRKGFFIRDGRIDVKDEQFILSDPCNILRLFTEGLRSGALIHPNAFRMVARHLDLIDDKLRADPEANRLMLDLIVKSDDPERALRRMNEIGVLGAFIPEFDPIVSLMQFNMYHHYTVDEHTINAVGGLKRLEQGELIEDLPVASEIIAGGVDLTVLYMAVLLHDIGKGRPEPHEHIGADIAMTVCPNLGLNEAQTELVVWLVRNHLVMSDVAQKRDISDPATIKAFAEQVRSVKRLKLLLVLTALDIRAVGPGTWNNWKAQLLRSLYSDSLAELTPGVEHSSRAQRADEAKQALRDRLHDWAADDVDRWIERHYQPYWLGLSTDIHEQFARMSITAEPDALHSAFRQDQERDVTQCCFYVSDHPGIFSRMAGALALAGASVVDARTFTDNSGMASTFFSIQDAEGRPIEEDRHARLRRSIHRTLRGDIIARDALRSRRKVKRRERPFDVPTTITFDNDGSDLYTVIEVDTRDRIGLLYDLTRTLTGVGVNIVSAVITTYGEQAVDSFYVKDVFGFKIKDKKKQQAIEDKLKAAISRARTEALEQA